MNTTMKLQFLFITLLVSLLFTACQKEEVNCRDGVLGEYENPATTATTYKIQTGDGDKGVVFTYTEPDGQGGNTVYVLNGELNSSCTGLTFTDQEIYSGNKYSGTLSVQDDKIVGTLNAADPNITTFPVNITKK